MNFHIDNNYRTVIRLIFKLYPQIHQELVQDLHDWLDGEYDFPKTKELKSLILDISKG